MNKALSVVMIVCLLLTSYLIYEIKNIENPNTTTELAGVIRNTGSGWSTIEDAGHASIGISNVSSNEEGIVITYKKPVSKIHTFIVTPDETMSKDGMQVGVSAGLDKAYIFIFDRNGNPVNPLEYKESASNIWIYAKLLK